MLVSWRHCKSRNGKVQNEFLTVTYRPRQLSLLYVNCRMIALRAVGKFSGRRKFEKVIVPTVAPCLGLELQLSDALSGLCSKLLVICKTSSLYLKVNKIYDTEEVLA
jgi:hypothetical protein